MYNKFALHLDNLTGELSIPPTILGLSEILEKLGTSYQCSTLFDPGNNSGQSRCLSTKGLSFQHIVWKVSDRVNRDLQSGNVKLREETGDSQSHSEIMSREFRLILRFMGTDIDGTKKVAYGLGKIRGVGPNLAFAVVRAAKINPEARMGALSDGELSRVEDVIKDPLKHGIPPRMVNRRKDIETGRDMHLVGADLALKIKSDIDLMKDIKSWKGIRHSLGLKVRGQRTRTTGRSGKAVGVKKKVLMEAARAAGRKEKEEEKK